MAKDIAGPAFVDRKETFTIESNIPSYNFKIKQDF